MPGAKTKKVALEKVEGRGRRKGRTAEGGSGSRKLPRNSKAGLAGAPPGVWPRVDRE